MIPILYSAIEKSFTSNGLGRLTTCTDCKVTEERNGVYECEFVVSVTDKRYSDCVEGNIIAVTHDDTGDVQPFVIYRRSIPIDGMVTVNAHHISYGLNSVILKPFEATSVADAFAKFETQTFTGNPFTFWTNKGTAGNFSVSVPTPNREVLGGTRGSILDIYGGGEYEFDKFEVRLYQNRGADRGVTIRYGKNLTDLKHTIDTLDLYNAVVPFWSDTDGNVIYGDIVKGNGGIIQRDYWTNEAGLRMNNENGEIYTFRYALDQVTTMDLSQEFDEAPTAEELEAKAVSILNGNEPWTPKSNIKVDFVALWNTDEYKDIAPLERVNLCDTVTIYHPSLGINVKTKVIKTVYNVLTDRYDEIELGTASTSFAQVMTAETEAKLEDVPTNDMMADAIRAATDAITGGKGGNIVFTFDGDGHPIELLIMDTDSIETAVNVWRWNLGGLGHSHNGYNGPFDDVAITQDGKINAALITVGTMLANRIKGGTLTLGGADNGNGVLQVLDSDDEIVGEWDKNGITAKSLTAENYVYVDGDTTSFFKIPFSQDSDNYLQLSSGGFLVKQGNSAVRSYTGGGLIGQYAGLVSELGNYYASFSPNDLSTGIKNGSTLDPTCYFPSMTTGVSKINTQETDVNGFLKIVGNTSVNGRFTVTGTKNRVVKTDDYAARLLYCYETPSPLFGDVGEGVISDDGLCYVFVDGIFAETVNLTQYQVFLQTYGEGEAYVVKRCPSYFVVKGTAGLAFGWEIKAKQSDYDQLRLDRYEEEIKTGTTEDYGRMASEYIADLKGGRL